MLPPRPPAIPCQLAVGEPFAKEFGPRLKIALDGIEQRDAISYDCDAGMIERFCRTDDGGLIVEGEGGEWRIKLEVVAGAVAVEWRKP